MYIPSGQRIDLANFNEGKILGTSEQIGTEIYKRKDFGNPGSNR